MKKIAIFLAAISSAVAPLDASLSTDPIVTAEKYVEYKRKIGYIHPFTAPHIVLVCYQQSTFQYFADKLTPMTECEGFSNLYLIDEGRVGILAGWGIGAPCLALKMEQLIALGTTKFLAVGTAGTLLDRHPIGSYIIAAKALAEDGVAHLYLNGEPFAKVDKDMFTAWNEYTKRHSLPGFQEAASWSFPALFKESPADLVRVDSQGCSVVEMEASTLYAVGQEKGAKTLSLFVISDSITVDKWTPHIKEANVRNNLHQLADWALDFCKEIANDGRDAKMRNETTKAFIRPMREEDVEALIAKFSFPWSTTEATRELWRNNYREHQENIRTVAIVEGGKEILGYGSLLRRSEYPHFENIPEINAIWIHDDFRRKGLGKQLIAYLEDLAKKEGYKQIGIGVGLYQDYGPAQKLYFQLGYKPDGHGATYKCKAAVPGESYPMDDDLILWLIKPL